MGAMTRVGRPVRRRTERAYAVLYAKPRPIVVTIAVPDVLRFREAGGRDQWELPIVEAFRHAVRLAASGNR